MHYVEAGISAEYVKEWIYYLYWLFLWIWGGIFFLLFFCQFMLEFQLVRQVKSHIVSVTWRFFLALFFFFLFGVSVHGLFRQKLQMSGDTYWGMGFLAERNGEYGRAFSFFKKADEKGENTPLFYLDYAGALHQLGKEKEALGKLQRCHGELFKKDILSGKIDYALGRYDDARKVFEEATLLVPGDLVARAWLGEDYIKLKQNQKAREAFLKILRSPALPEPVRKKIKRKLAELREKP